MKLLIVGATTVAVLLNGVAATAQTANRARAIEAVRSGNTGAAGDIYRELLQADSGNQLVRRDLMWLMWEAGEYAESLVHAEALVESLPDDFEALEVAARSNHRLGNLDRALELYRRVLAVRPGQVGLQLELVRIFETQKDYRRAQEALDAVRQINPELPEAAPVQARLHEVNGRMSEAAQFWAKAVAAFPANIDYVYREARALHFAGDERAADTRLEALLKERPDHQAARELFINLALLDDRIDDAVARLRLYPQSGTAADVPQLLRLAALHIKVGEYGEALEALETGRRLTPKHPEVLLMQAETLQRLGRWQDSIAVCREALEVNPASPRGWLVLAGGLEASGQTAPAMEAIISARQLDPTSPALLVRESRARYLAGQTNEAGGILEAWLARQADNSPEVPVLLYHGLAVSDRDPMLASQLHLGREQFARQLRGLRDAGYQTITLEQMRDWLNQRQPLPERPLLITFDDGRLDSFTNATPILKETGFNAVMFVAGVNSSRNLPGYATWDELVALYAAGSWQLGSHGDAASLNLPVTPDGLTGKFLANRQWLTPEQRLETVEEWRQRVRADYAAIKEKLATLAGVEPIANAWPEGNFGQQAMVNTPEAARHNLELTREFFSLGFHQNGNGVNSSSRDPLLLERLEPRPDWTADELIGQLAGRSPTVLVLRELLNQSLWNRDPAAARQWLDRLRQHRNAPADLDWERARVAFLEGRHDEAAQAALKLLESEPPMLPARKVEVLNFLTAVHLAAGDSARAYTTCQTSLELDPEQPGTMLDLATILEIQRQPQRSLEICLNVREAHPEFARVLPFLGRLCDRMEAYAEAAKWWQESATAYPENADYPYLALKSRYMTGEHDAAMAELSRWLVEHPGHLEARRFLIQCALVRGDVNRTLELLGEQRDLMDSVPSSLHRQIAGYQLQQGQHALAEAELRRAIASDPKDGENLLLLAETIRLAGRVEEAAEWFHRVAEQNPASRRARLGQADALVELGRSGEALESVQHLRKTEPVDPGLCLREAGLLYADGKHQASQDLLKSWFEQNQGPALPVLCYHGLATDPLDPMLAQRYHHTVATFEDHLKHLKTAGYTTITARQAADWKAGLSDLPEKAVMISFDDGRLDSLRHADPLLARYGFQAVMFVDGRNASRNLPGYATWEELAGFHRSGRWDLQSHGDLASSRIVADSAGREGKFLVSRQWLDEQNRHETGEEWAGRIREEHRRMIAQMQQHLGYAPVAFAWPEGDYGQEAIPGFPETAGRNLELAGEFHQLAFHQDSHGMNLPKQSPMRLNRLEPPQAWSGGELLQRLQNGQPQVRIAYQLLRQAAWLGRIHEGYRWLDVLEQSGASAGRILIAQALLRTLAGDEGHAQMLLAEGSPDLQALRDYSSLTESIENRLRADGRLTFEAWMDDDDRRTLSGRFSAGMQLSQATRVRVEAGVSEYHEDDLDTSFETTASLKLENQLSAFHRIDAGVGGHHFSGPGQDTLSFLARWEASWSDAWRTGVGWEYLPGYTVEALIENIRFHRAQMDGDWALRDDLELRLVVRYWDYSDGNSRVDATVQLGYELTGLENLKGLYRLTLADTRDEVPAYYTPQELIQNQVGAEYLWRPTDHLAWRFRYLIGYGHEMGEGGRIVHAAHTGVLFRNVGGLNIRPSLDYQQTPAYQMFRVMLTVDWNF